MIRAATWAPAGGFAVSLRTSERPRLLRVHVRHRPHRDPGAGGVEDLVGRAVERVRLDRDHRQGRPRPHLLVDAHAALALEPGARQHPGPAAERRLGERQPSQALPHRGAGPRHAAVETGHVDPAVRGAQAIEQAAQDPDGIRSRPAEVAAVDGPVEARHLDVHLHEAAQLPGDRGDAGREVVGVGEHHDVGVQLRAVALKEGRQAGRADLLLPLDQEPEVDRHATGRPQVGGGGGHPGQEAALVVGGPAPVEAALLLHGQERRARPLPGRPRRDHVVVAVHEDGRRTRRVQPVAVDVRRHPGQGEDGDVLDAETKEDVAGHLGRAPQVVDREARGRDAGDAHELAEQSLELAEALVDRSQRGRASRRSPGCQRSPLRRGSRGADEPPSLARLYMMAVGGAGSSAAPAFDSGRRDM